MVQSQWIAPPTDAPRQVLGAITNTTKEAFGFTLPAHVLAIFTVILNGTISFKSAGGKIKTWQAMPARHALGGFTHCIEMLAAPGTSWVSLFTRADTWSRLSGKDATTFSNCFFEPQWLAELRCHQSPPLTLFKPDSELGTDPNQIARHLLHRVCTDLAQAPSRRETALLDTALAALEHQDLPEMIDSLGIGERRLQRLFKSELGMSAKMVQRMARLHRTVNYWNASEQGQISIAELAHVMGYADQAHLARDFRLLVGHAPRNLKQSEASEDNLLWALLEGSRRLAPGVFGHDLR